MSKRKFAKTNQVDPEELGTDIIGRVKELRIARYGRRGRVRFCDALGISPSTYHYYERDRVPPAGLLIRMAEVTQTDLLWLLTGRGSPERVRQPAIGEQPLIRRAAELLERSPAANRAMAAFLELLERVQAVEQHRAAGRGSRREQGPIILHPLLEDESGRRGVIPVLGRTAAGVPQFWKAGEGGEGLSCQMDEALEQLRAGRRVAGEIGLLDGTGPEGTVALIQLSEPVTVAGLSVCEAIDAPEVTRHWPEAFALRVDGDSMQPLLWPDDLVILSPGEKAISGEPAVVQLRDQIGVTCKIYRRTRTQVRLIPQNDAYRTTAHRPGEIVWALRVLARAQMRPAGAS